MRIIMGIASVLLAIGLFSSSGNTSEIYQWTDQNGIKHFSHTPPPTTQKEFKSTDEIPGTQNALPVSKQKNQTPSSGVKKPSKPVSTSKKTYQNNTVELFSTAWCGYCTKARQFLIANNIPFKEYDIDKDKAAAARKKKLSGRNGVPYAIINGKGVYGFSQDAYARALGLK